MHHQHHQQVVVPSLRLCQMVGGAIVISSETDFPAALFNNCTAIMLRCTRLSFMQQATPEQDLPCKKINQNCNPRYLDLKIQVKKVKPKP